MSDQSLVPQKPKPGSLRDRIAAFEKSATAGAGAIHGQPPPQPRPKPAGFATWKPKQPSPPSSPSPSASQTEHAQGPSSGMSASDARQSITKGGSLKDRMAALQNRGAFGAPPPVGPKPTVERPKWKPPPVLPQAQVDETGDISKEAASGMAAIEKTIASPLPVSLEGKEPESGGDEGAPTPVGAPETTTTNEDGEGTPDPEEEERQRRAAIAARMARLGGARLGMAPPIVGKKPPVRKPTQEEQLKTDEETKLADPNPTSPLEEQNVSTTELTSGASPPSEMEKPGPSSRKNSGAFITTEAVENHPSKIPAAMPVPAVPRRTGPPRKKPSKPTTEPPVPPTEILAVDLGEDERKETDSATLETHETLLSAEHEEKQQTTTGSPEEISALGDAKPESRAEEPNVAVPTETTSSPPLASEAPSVWEPISGTRPPPPSHAADVSEIEGEEAQVTYSPSAAIPPLRALAAAELQSSALLNEDEVADRLEALGGINDLSSSTELTSDPSRFIETSSKSVQEEEDIDEDDGISEVVNDDVQIDNMRDHPPLSPFPIPSNQPSVKPTQIRQGETTEEEVTFSQRPVLPPRRLVPEVPEERDEEQEEEQESDGVDENLAQSRLFVPPPRERTAVHPRHRNIQDEDDGAGDGSENDAPALPVPHRRSLDTSASGLIQSDNSSDIDSDYDGEPLPIPLRSAPPPRVVPPPPNQDCQGNPTSVQEAPSISLDREVMDEDEGDPIDPDFLIQSKRASYINPNSQSPALPVPDVQSEESEESRKQTIAGRMARLSGIKFGAAPIPVPVHRPPPTLQQEDEQPGGSAGSEGAQLADEEEEEKARKERIAAKLASMGGLRIGMMPMGLGGLPAQRSNVHQQPRRLSSLPDHISPPVSPRPPPITQPRTVDSDTDDGVKVEAEESEAEEVSYQDAEPEEAPPPLPSRTGRPARRQESTETAVSPPPSRPPAFVTPSRRMSAQIPSPASQQMNPSPVPQDYVMVEQENQENQPPLARRASRIPPARSTPEVPTTAESQDNKSSAWGLPSIPTPILDLETSVDLSSSWTDAGDSLHPSQSQPSQSPSLRGKTRKSSGVDKPMSIDDLIAEWGRVGVQVCEVATTLFEKSKKTLIGDGTYSGFVKAVLADVPNAAEVAIDAGEYGYPVYSQNGSVVQKRLSDIMPGDIIEVHDARFKGHKGLQTYQLTVGGSGELVVGIVGEFEAKKSKVKVFQANQHVGQQTVESVSYRLEDLKSGTIKIYRVLEA